MSISNRNLSVFALLLMASLFLAGCPTTDRTLDPAGPYGGDRVLFELDTAIDETTETIDAVLQWAERNQAFVNSRPDVAEKVAKVRAEVDGVPHPQETLIRLHSIRDAYLIAKTATPEDVREEIRLGRTLLETARSLLTLL